MNSIKVLSIDWDYFVDCPIDFKVENFPDGGNENLSEWVLDAIWVNRYAQCRKLKDVDEDTKELIKLRIMLKQVVNQYTTVVIADSHKDIYKYLEQFRQTKIPIDLYNIDFHHDVYGFQNDDVDCGNWLRLFMNSSNNHDKDTYTWVRREDSELSGDEIIDDNSIVGIPKELSESTTPFQFVFLCKSGVWSPPHLDKEFLSLCRLLNKLSNKSAISDQIALKDRYTKQFKDNVKHCEDIMKRFRMEVSNEDYIE